MNPNRFNRREFLLRTAVATGGLLLTSCASSKAKVVKRTAVDQVPLGRTGIKLSRVGMGTGSNGGGVQKALGQEKFNDLVHYAYDQGITYFDCAQNYQTFGWIKGAIKGLPREKLFIQSKIPGIPENPLAAIDKHRQMFDTDYVDSMLIHCMTKDKWTDQWKRVMDAFNEAQEKKWILAKGVSCHSLPALQDATVSPWTQVHLVRVNPQGAFMDGQDGSWDKTRAIAPVMAEIEQMHAQGRGVIGMKIIGNGTFTSPEDRQKSINFAMSKPAISAIVIGFKSTAEVDEGLSRVNQALRETA